MPWQEIPDEAGRPGYRDWPGHHRYPVCCGGQVVGTEVAIVGLETDRNRLTLSEVWLRTDHQRCKRMGYGA